MTTVVSSFSSGTAADDKRTCTDKMSYGQNRFGRLLRQSLASCICEQRRLNAKFHRNFAEKTNKGHLVNEAPGHTKLDHGELALSKSIETSPAWWRKHLARG